MQIFTRSLLAFFLCLPAMISMAQKIIHVEKSPIVCYASAENKATRVDAPLFLNAKTGNVKTATIVVDYVGFSAQAQTAFQTAVDIWEGLLTSPVTIRVKANWRNLGAGVLGSAGPTFFISDFDGAPQLNVGYAGPLAEKLAGKNLNDPAAYDIEANFNSDFNWYYNSTGTPASGQYDLISVILHELGHGLGFVDSYNYDGGLGEYGSFNAGVPLSYDINIETSAGENLYSIFEQGKTDLGSRLVSNNLFYKSPLILAGNGGQRAKIYAPSPWSAGSSIAHLDESTYLAGNQNSLMSPQFAAREVIHSPGPITMNLFKDMGWSTIYINHKPIASTEDANASAFEVVAVVKGDESAGYSLDNEDIFLHYYTSLNSSVTSIKMDGTGNPDEYSATLPAPGGNAVEYFYYISAGDNLSRTITKPGKVNIPLQATTQGYFAFEAGVDVTAPFVNHAPSVISFQDEEVKIEAAITERYNLNSVTLEYSLAGVPQSNLPMEFVDSVFNILTGLNTYHYEATVSLTSLIDGDEFTYKIVAEDNSSNTNVGYSPASDSHVVIFKGIKPTQNSYSNNFNVTSDDFIGNDDEFSITQPAGFSNPAIHTVHPYPEASAVGEDELNFIYTLRVPVTVRSIEATIKFDEIVIVEPGEPGAIFGTQDFYDYVVVEGSKDGGETWTHVANGYDATDYAPWISRFLTSGDGNPTLFRTRELNLLNKFTAGDEVLIRFRLFSDPGAAGWGWAIDNLKIQIDDEAPEILHTHVDYIMEGTESLDLVSEITDNIEIEKVIVELGYNNQPTETEEELVNQNAAEFTIPLDNLDDLSVGDKIIYKITAIDATGNSVTLPAEGYFEIGVVELHNHVDQYANDFNSPSNDFVGNFFSIAQPADFSNGAIHSTHDYVAGFGPEHASDFSYTLKKSIVLNADNPRIRFDEIVIVEGHANGVVFGAPGFNDYVIVEGSKDDGETWQPFLDGYDAKDQTAWQAAFTNGTNGKATLFKSRTIDMTESGDFAADDHVNIRFRMYSDNANIGWGWAIDNLYIQDVVTGAPKELEANVSVYPNPAKGDIIVKAERINAPSFNIKLVNAQGINVYSATENVVEGKLTHKISSESLPAGIYLVKIGDGTNSIIRKVVKVD